jgi:hypothetical protein
VLTDCLDRIYSIFERAEALSGRARAFDRKPGALPDDLPLEYRVFVSAGSRVLGDWQFYSFYGTEDATLDEINDQASRWGIPKGFRIFAREGHEDYWLFKDRQVYAWCGHDDPACLATDEPFATSFSLAMVKRTEMQLKNFRARLESVEEDLRIVTVK